MNDNARDFNVRQEAEAAAAEVSARRMDDISKAQSILSTMIEDFRTTLYLDDDAIVRILRHAVNVPNLTRRRRR